MNALEDALRRQAPQTVVIGGSREAAPAAGGATAAAVRRWLADRPRRVEVGFTRPDAPRLVALRLGQHATFLLRPAEAAALAARLQGNPTDPLAQPIAEALGRVVGQVARGGPVP